MNTECHKCIFNGATNECVFQIPILLKDHYVISKKNNANYIENYKCAYAFSTDVYDKHKENLPNDMQAFIKDTNKLNYYMIWDCEGLNSHQIIELYEHHIFTLHTQPQKISIIAKLDSNDETQALLNYLKHNVSMPWKLHHIIESQNDDDKLFDILNVNIINHTQNIWFIKADSMNDLTNELNYINFLHKILKPKYAAIRKNNTNLDGLFISVDNLKLIKNEHEDKYIKFLQENNTIVRKYYEP